MKNILIKTVLIIGLLVMFAIQAQAVNFVQVVVDSQGIPTLLDSDGHVWSTHQLVDNQEVSLYQLPNLNHIKQIRPLIALDNDGNVFTWFIDGKQVDGGPDGLEHTGYTNPQQVSQLRNVTNIDGYAGSYVAVGNNQDVFSWVGDGKISKLYSKEGIKAISSHYAFEVHPINGSPILPESKSLVLLFNNGDVLGLGIKQTGAPTRVTELKEVQLAKFSEATDIGMNAVHTIVLASDGTPKFWGGCDVYGVNNSGRKWDSNTVNGVDGYITDVVSMGIYSGSDNTSPDVFIKKDGSVWVAFAPLPEGTSSKDCGNYAPTNHKVMELKIGPSKAVQAVTYTMTAYNPHKVIVLDSSHELWFGSVQFYTKLPMIQLNKIAIVFEKPH